MKPFLPTHKQQGFALLYAVLLTGIILTIGLGLSSILTKQIILSSIGANSQKAYYAANTIKECVLHWGIYGGTVSNPNGSAFGGWYVSADDSLQFLPPDSDAQIVCGLATLPVVNGGQSTNEYGVNFYQFTVGDSACNDLGNDLSAAARVTMYASDPVTNKGAPISVVEATGYGPSCTEGPRRVERVIKGSGEFSNPFSGPNP